MKGLRAYNPTQLLNDGLLGQYSIGGDSGLIAAATTGELFQFRWTDSLRLAAIRRVLISAVASTPFGATPAAALAFDLVRATAWTVQGTGGTSLDTTTGSGRRRTQMPNSLLGAGDMRISTTAALGAGTKTLDSLAMASVTGDPVSATTGAVIPPMTALIDAVPSMEDYPLVLAQNEGFVVRLTSDPGTGTMFFAVTVEWWECHAS